MTAACMLHDGWKHAVAFVPVERVDNPEATARGAAWLAAGCPSHWMVDDSIKCFNPVADETLFHRYSQYRLELNRKLELSA